MKILKKISISMVFLSIFCMFVACSQIENIDNDREKRNSLAQVLVPVASEEKVIVGNVVQIDISNVSQGYFMVKYNGDNKKIKMQVNKEGSPTYTYDLEKMSEFETFPISQGNGTYSLTINENIQGNTYAIADTMQFDVELESEILPFLYPNKYVKFDKSTRAISIGEEISKNAYSDLDVIKLVYDYAVGEIDYDYESVENVTSFYIPNVDNVLESKKGLCFDYAALMTVMLRTQRIPTQLVIGYAGDEYHAWINVYTKETGWIYAAIEFNGTQWTRLDPTFADTSNQSTGYIDKETSYHAMFYY